MVISISDWKSKDDWTNWLKSVNRKSIRDAHKESISSETFTMLLKSNEDNKNNECNYWIFQGSPDIYDFENNRITDLNYKSKV